LYGHLSKIDVHTGDAVQRGRHIAVMGYTGAGINRERAHVHLELNLIMNHKFDGWYGATHQNDPNYHGIYNGINLVGLDIEKLYLELHDNPSLTIPQFLSREEVFYKIVIPHSRHFELPRLYPWMANGDAEAEPPSWEVSFARSGLPLRMEPSDRKVKEPVVAYVKPSGLNASYLTNGVATGPTSHAHLTEYGQQMMHLLTWPD
jgi:murein DD-endopeptidase MepM/ murein hydrolase activator NlpD